MIEILTSIFLMLIAVPIFKVLSTMLEIASDIIVNNRD